LDPVARVQPLEVGAGHAVAVAGKTGEYRSVDDTVG
jgi:hypothetical protein